MKISWTVREVRAEHARTIANHRYYGGEPQADIEAYAAWLAPRVDRHVYVGYVAEAEGKVIAGAGAVLLDWGPTRGSASGTRARIVNVFTEPPWRRKGISRKLVGSVMSACEGHGVRTFSLAASLDGQQLYVSLGFAPYPSEMVLRR